MRVTLSEAADADIAEILSYSIASHGRAAAEIYVGGIKRASELLIDHPAAGVAHPDIDPLVRSLPYRAHRLYYQIEPERILVLRVLHRSMDAARWLNE
ncbi:type II toxin-antitoxin system RelE/ParE family toxin [Sphingomonas sp. HF-S4]|uniref:Type II toxin-antitoxin system RelE/ParE family toxin n=1 Tax=Sphingomonas agrestis TaxID=3080540 RepID=A0ABU3YBC5_9SPHN|nr:type II toxin-antitoxin system RelE/ParE family toxin [Sphingomonas sp. HF-S4]MDV3458703.1 type II toxin-antitoxin system RelE/ParE family toxin [Sphingomonas sp. HF-S4]